MFAPGSMAFIVLVAGIPLVLGLFVYQAVRRLHKKLGPDAQPTAWTYINELGGYIVVGVIYTLALIGWLISHFFFGGG